ncbi:MAG TPA: hypothetical protein VGM75_20315, partial [Pseudonocardiaceae bacterium]
MANADTAAHCASCGKPLPVQQGRGRIRRYCDATCRSAARRRREQEAPRTDISVNEPLTNIIRKPNIDNVPGLTPLDPTALAAGLLD